MAGALAATPPGSTLSTTPPSSLSPQSTFSSSPSQANTVSGAAIVQYALKYLGYPYTATGNSPATGFSCIGFVSYVYRSLGIPLPGDLADAYAYAPKVPFSDLQPGDILFFQNTVWPGISHAAIYIGGGKFVHAEWYNRGVVVSSFANDPVDGNYWTGKYLGANRPWGGASVAPAVGSAAPTTGVGSAAPTSSTQTHVANGPTALVSVSAVNVRSGPSMNNAVQTVASEGTSVVILGKRNGWYKVQLPNGTVGWIIAAGIGKGSASGSGGSAGTSSTVASSATPNGANGANGAAPTVGNPTAPARQGMPARASRLSTTVQASGLRVHTAPSINAAVVTTLPRGQHMQVLARRNGWVKVLLPDGTVGWVSSAYVAARHHAATAVRSTYTTTSGSVTVTTRPGGKIASVAMNVRVGPSLGDAVATVIAPGGRYHVLGWSNGWAHVQLPDGTTGWVDGTVLGGAGTSTAGGHLAKRVSTSAAHTGHVLTAGVRIHSAPGVNAPVVGLAAAGTHVKVLGFKAGWVLIRLPGGTSGYVDGAYVR